jgi:menaquinone-dependent protoporphyrinogen IX oxidase
MIAQLYQKSNKRDLDTSARKEKMGANLLEPRGRTIAKTMSIWFVKHKVKKNARWYPDLFYYFFGKVELSYYFFFHNSMLKLIPML